MILATPAMATEGMFALGFSTNQRAMGGTGVAYGYEAMSATLNPANAANVGHEMQFGLDIFSPNRGFTMGGPRVESNSNYFPVPNFSYNKPLDNGKVFNISVYGNGGMNTDYPINMFGAGSPTGIDLSQMFISATYAGKSGNLSWGISPTVVIQTFSANGLPFGSGRDWSYGGGLRAGIVYEASSQLSFGLSASSKMNMTKFDKYAGLFENRGEFDIPGSITAGLAYKANSKLTMMLDVQRIFYSGVDAISNATNAGPLGAPGGAGFGWDDINVLKLGMEYKANDTMTWRAGYAYSENPVGPEDVSLGILAPGVVTHHLTVGGTYSFNPSNSIDFAIEYAPENTVTGGPITLDMSQFSVSVGWTRKF
jgi:long-chain fatty acid transport protein